MAASSGVLPDRFAGRVRVRVKVRVRVRVGAQVRVRVRVGVNPFRGPNRVRVGVLVHETGPRHIG